MRLLYVTHFFPPEKGAAANRAYRIAKGLVSHGFSVDVLTGFPNYPDGVLPPQYRRSGTKVYRTRYGFNVIRVPVQPAGNDESLMLRLANQISFLLYGLIRKGYLDGGYDIIFASSPPLFAGLLGLLLSDLLGGKFVLDIRDLWPEAGGEALGKVGKIAMAPFSSLARILYKHADLITVTADTMKEVVSIYTRAPVLWFPNGMDRDERMRVSVVTGYRKEVFGLVSAGILGRLQDNELLRDIGLLLPPFMRLDVVGGGIGARYFADTAMPDNVRYWGILPHKKTLSIVARSHVGLALWKDYYAARYVIPMRVVEYLSLGKPAVLTTPTGVGPIIEEYGAGLVLGKCDAQCVVAQISELSDDRHLYEEMSQNALYIADKFFDMEKNIAKFTEYLKEVV